MQYKKFIENFAELCDRDVEELIRESFKLHPLIKEAVDGNSNPIPERVKRNFREMIKREQKDRAAGGEWPIWVMISEKIKYAIQRDDYTPINAESLKEDYYEALELTLPYELIEGDFFSSYMNQLLYSISAGEFFRLADEYRKKRVNSYIDGRRARVMAAFRIILSRAFKLFLQTKIARPYLDGEIKENGLEASVDNISLGMEEQAVNISYVAYDFLKGVRNGDEAGGLYAELVRNFFPLTLHLHQTILKAITDYSGYYLTFLNGFKYEELTELWGEDYGELSEKIGD
jgi:hypothetical protein